jgi:hypothetical protein
MAPNSIEYKLLFCIRNNRALSFDPIHAKAILISLIYQGLQVLLSYAKVAVGLGFILTASFKKSYHDGS